MTSHEFVIWLKGFVEACNDFTATPKQWDTIKEELGKVTDEKVQAQFTENQTWPPAGINPYYIGDVPGWLNPFNPSGTNTQIKFTATNKDDKDENKLRNNGL